MLIKLKFSIYFMLVAIIVKYDLRGILPKMSRDIQTNAEYKEAHDKITIEDVLKAHDDVNNSLDCFHSFFSIGAPFLFRDNFHWFSLKSADEKKWKPRGKFACWQTLFWTRMALRGAKMKPQWSLIIISCWWHVARSNESGLPMWTASHSSFSKVDHTHGKALPATIVARTGPEGATKQTKFLWMCVWRESEMPLPSAGNVSTTAPAAPTHLLLLVLRCKQLPKLRGLVIIHKL